MGMCRDKRRYSDVRGCCGWSRWSSGCEHGRVPRGPGRGRVGRRARSRGRSRGWWTACGLLGRSAGDEPSGGGAVAGGVGGPGAVGAGVGRGRRGVRGRGRGWCEGSAVTAVLPWERLGSKVGDQHLQRLAVVYVRQSTRQQVLDHQESTRLQYALVERAVALGWPADRVVVIDEDLGKSAASAAGRAGFQRLVTEITMGHVGLVLGIEMSRLARSGSDWYQLLELCALSGALLADADGVYDPAEYNDRLLLGLKGTMSEAELHLLKQRMLAGKQAKARRGGLAIGLPVGHVGRPPGGGGPGPPRP